MGGLLRLVQRGGAWAGCGPAKSPPRCTKYNNPPINGQCTNYILFDVAPIKALTVGGMSWWKAKLCGGICLGVVFRGEMSYAHHDNALVRQSTGATRGQGWA